MTNSLRRVGGLGAAVAMAVATLVLATPSALAQAPPTTAAAEDSYVSSASPAANYGTATTLQADANPTRVGYLKFVVSSVPTTPVRLRVYAQTASNSGLSAFPVADSSWTETGLTFDNRPTQFGPQLGSATPHQAGTWVEFDVTSVVTGPGTYSFAVTTTSNTAVKVSSREDAANQPHLMFGQVSTSSTFVISRSGETYTALGNVGGVAYTGRLKAVGERAVADLMAGGGGTISFTAGTFDFGTEYFKLENVRDIVFAGAGRDQTVIRNSSSEAADTEPFNFTGADRVTIRDLTVHGGGAVRLTSDAIDFDKGNTSTVDNVRITGSRGRGVVFDGKNFAWTANGNTVRNCEITGVPGDGIELLASSDNLIEGCTITGVRGHGIQFAKSTPTADQPNKKSSGNTVRNNTIDNSGQDGINWNGGDGNRVENNRITNSSDVTSSRDGIRIGTGDGVSCNDNVVQGNTATDNQATKTQRYGLAITSSLCNRTVVGPNDFTGNRIGPILDQGTATRYPQDTQPPTAPTGVTATAVSASLVRVTWTASVDDVGVTEYRVHRNGGATPLATVGGTTLSFDDTTVAASTTYTYRVVAADAAGNASPPSDPPASATTPAGSGGVLTFNPVADTYVNEASPTTNYGTSTQLRIDASPVVRSYLRFTVQGVAGTVTSAKLRVYAVSSSSTGHDVRGVADNTWGESVITFGTAPAVGGVVASSGSFTGGRYIEVDVRALITGNGTYSVALTGPGATAVSYTSRESATRPELVLTVG